MLRDRGVKFLNSVLSVKVVVAAFNQEKALVGAFSVITNLWMEIFEALVAIPSPGPSITSRSPALLTGYLKALRP